MAKIAIIGAGQVGATTAYTLGISGLAEEIVLTDIHEKKAAGEALDIAHALAAGKPVKVSSGGWDVLAGADLVVMTAGANQAPGESRRALADKNMRIMESVAGEIANRAPECILLVVSNPVDALTRTAVYCTGFPPSRVMGSGTALDSMRFRWMLAAHTGLDPRNIHAYVLGEHGDSELPAWSITNITGMDVGEYCRQCGGCNATLPERMKAEFDRDVRGAAYTIIENKGVTNYGVALAVHRIAQAVLRNEHAIHTVSTLLNGAYGLKDVCLSLPCVVGRSGVERVLSIPLSPEESVMLRHSAYVVRSMARESAGESAALAH